MTITATTVAPPDALEALAAAIATAKRGDPLTPVTVAVPTNTCGVMTRRALGRAGGVAGIDMVTLNRLAELIAGPVLAAADRSPMSTPVVDLAVASALERHPGPFAPVATHPSTVVALRRLHEELRLAGPAAMDALAAHSARGAHGVRISRAVTAQLERRWYDEADLFTHASSLLREGALGRARSLVIHLPQELSPVAIEFVRALGDVADVHVVVQLTGDADADADARELVASLGVDATAHAPSSSETGPAAVLSAAPGPPAAAAGTPIGAPASPGPVRPPAAIITTTDADDEVRIAARLVLDAARDGVPFERIAVLWPAQQPYARLVEHHLDAASIPWNGRPGTTTTERLAPRLVLDLLDVDRRGLRRRDLFALLADVPARGTDGAYLPTAEWERVSRRAGISRDEDWNRRLGGLAGSDRWGPSAGALQSFVAELRGELGHPAQERRWWDWAQWCTEQLDRWIGRATLERLPDPEYRAWEVLTAALDRLRHLDPVGAPVTRHQFRATLEAELDASPGRRGRVGDGVTVGPLAGAVGLDVDIVILVGAAEGVLPPTPASDPLLSEQDRVVAGLPTSDARALRLRRLFHAALATAQVTVTIPRGDLRATSEVRPSRWLQPWVAAGVAIARRDVESHHAGLLATDFPASSLDFRLRDRAAHVGGGGPLADAPSAAHDAVLRRGIAARTARDLDELTVFDGDLTSVEVPVLDHPVSPTRLETWVACPHAYFVRYLLRAAPIDEPDDEISITALDRGSAHHDALDMFHRAVIAGDLPQPTASGWSDAHRDALAGYFDEVCARTEGRGRTGRPAFWADERDRMRADLLTWLDRDSQQIAERRVRVVGSETEFVGDVVRLRLADGRTLAVQGSIDRVDLAEDGTIFVTDHKSGRDKFAKLSADDPTLGGTLFQLPVYAAAARTLFGDEATEVHAEYGLLAKGDYQRRGIRFTPEVDQRVTDVVSLVVEGIESGVFPNRPARPGWRMFVDCEYCEPDHLGTAERWAEWDRKRHDPRLRRWFGDHDVADDVEDAAAVVETTS